VKLSASQGLDSRGVS